MMVYEGQAWRSGVSPLVTLGVHKKQGKCCLERKHLSPLTSSASSMASTVRPCGEEDSNQPELDKEIGPAAKERQLRPVGGCK